jgi:prophage antirepressor-like protein
VVLRLAISGFPDSYKGRRSTSTLGGTQKLVTVKEPELYRLDADEKKDDIVLSDVIGRRQKTWCVNESGLYSLVLSSRKPEALG